MEHRQSLLLTEAFTRLALSSVPCPARSGLILILAIVLICAAHSHAPAQESQTLDPAAEALFLEGRRLYAERRYEQACNKFADSRRLEPAVGTTLNLARCQATLGRTATAWALYREAAAKSRELGQTDRERMAWQQAALLEPRLARLGIELDARFSTARPEVRLDGTLVPAGVVGGTIPVDPGRHRVSAHFQSREVWSTEIETAPATLTRVLVPYLEHAVKDAGVPGPRVAQPGEPTGDSGLWRAVPRSNVAESGLETRSIVAIVLAGVAVLAAGYGTTAAILAKNEYDDAQASSERDERMRKNDQAFDLAHQADLGFVVAGSALLGAGVLWFSAPPSNKIGATSGVSPGVSAPARSKSAGGGAMATVQYCW